MEVININEKAAEKKLSVFRKYFVEIAIVALCVVSGYLYKGQKELETLIRNYLITDKSVLYQKIDSSTHAIDVNTNVIKQNSEIIQELNKNYYRKK